MTYVLIFALIGCLWLALAGIDHQTARANRAEGEADEWRRLHNEAHVDRLFADLEVWRADFRPSLALVREIPPIHDDLQFARIVRGIDGEHAEWEGER